MKKLLAALIGALFIGAPAMAQSALTPPPTAVYGLKVGYGTKTATATSGAATLNNHGGVITTEALSTAAGATYTLTLTNSTIAAADQVFISVGNGTNSAGTPELATVTPGAGSVSIVVRNAHASAALNGTLRLAFMVNKN